MFPQIFLVRGWDLYLRVSITRILGLDRIEEVGSNHVQSLWTSLCPHEVSNFMKNPLIRPKTHEEAKNRIPNFTGLAAIEEYGKQGRKHPGPILVTQTS